MSSTHQQTNNEIGPDTPEAMLAVKEHTYIVKFGATWCKPCTLVSPLIQRLTQQIPEHVRVIHIDIDEHLAWFSILKSKRIVNGIPALVVYSKLNTNILAPEFVATGSNENAIIQLFQNAAGI